MKGENAWRKAILQGLERHGSHQSSLERKHGRVCYPGISGRESCRNGAGEGVEVWKVKESMISLKSAEVKC